MRADILNSQGTLIAYWPRPFILREERGVL